MYGNTMMDEETVELFSFIKSSPYRLKILKALKDEHKTPIQLSKEVDTRVFHVSKILRDFKDNEIAVCVNEKDRMFRYYRLTDKGLSLFKYL